jgi:hypothetical protein
MVTDQNRTNKNDQQPHDQTSTHGINQQRYRSRNHKTNVTFSKQKKFLCFTLKSYFAHENYEEIYTRFRQAVNGIEGYIGPEKNQSLGRHQLLIISSMKLHVIRLSTQI